MKEETKMKRQEMLNKLQEQVTEGKFRTMQKWSDKRLEKECIRYGIIDNTTEAEKEYYALTEKLQGLQGQLRGLVDDSFSGDVMMAICTDEYADCGETERTQQIRREIAETQSKLYKNEFYKFMHAHE